MLGTDSARADYTTVVNPATTWGTWQGWGCSLAWWAQAFGNRQDLANIVFSTSSTQFNGQSLPGLGLNIVRYNVGASSTAPANGQYMVASPNITASRQMQGFWLNPNSSDPSSSSWNWSVDANQRQMLQMAQASGANYFQLFSNSPMWWMCSNNNPSGAANGANDNLPAANYDTFAIYMATVAKYFSQNYGIAFNSVEPFNEPSAQLVDGDRHARGKPFQRQHASERHKLLADRAQQPRIEQHDHRRLR